MALPTDRERRKIERPQALLDAALALFVERGFAATRAEDIAARAGVAKGTVYLYFRSKEALLKAVIAQQLVPRLAQAATLRAREDLSTERLFTVELPALCREFHDSPASAVIKIIVGEVRQMPELAAHYMQTVVIPAKQLLAGLLERGVARGELRPMDVPATVHSLLLPLVMLCVHRHSLGACAGQADTAWPLDAPAFIDHHLRLMHRALAAETAAASAPASTAGACPLQASPLQASPPPASPPPSPPQTARLQGPSVQPARPQASSRASASQASSRASSPQASSRASAPQASSPPARPAPRPSARRRTE